MRFVPFSKVSAVLVAAALISAPMAEAGIPGADGLEKAKEAVTELVEDGVVEEMGVGERRVHHDASTKSRKPRMSTTGVRQTWTECVGMDVDETIDMIKTARPDLRRIMKVKEGAMVTMDMRMDRVRVYYNTENKVTRAPRVG